ncbi:hypothetical protein NIES208_14225 [[Limnothrix rosea] IAM M-220]|nr:hypothetical protein NIES208_14225 [[Limnothrix rosea] IAM M-220]
MGRQMQKPILVGGLGLSLGLAVLSRWQASVFDLGEWLFWGAIAAGGLMLWKQKQPAAITDDVTNPLTKKDVEQAINNAQDWVKALQAEAPDQDFSQLTSKLTELPQQFDRTEIMGAIAGGRGTGKTTLKQYLEKSDLNVSFIETQPLFTDLVSYDQATQSQVFAADFVLFLVTGDLMASQWDTLKHWVQARQKIILLFNKQDQYQSEQRELILSQLRRHVFPAIAAQNVIGITAAPQPIKVKKIEADGTETEYLEQPEADLETIQTSLQQLLDNPEIKQQLVWSTIWRTARLVQHQAKEQLTQLRRQKAMPILEKYQWLAAGATFANPVAALDLLATAAVTGQMIVDLGTVYQQRISLSQAQTIATALGKQMIQLGLVELSTQAIAGVLKTNIVTYVAGGAVQGISAAYLTHIAGLSLIQYFQEQPLQSQSETINLEKLGRILKTMFEQNQRSKFLQSFSQKVLERRSPQTAT